MRVLIITQDDPFYLADNLNYLFNKSSDDINYVGCVLLSFYDEEYLLKCLFL